MKETKSSRYVTELPRSKNSKKLTSEVNIDLLQSEEVLGMTFPWTYVPNSDGLSMVFTFNGFTGSGDWGQMIIFKVCPRYEV